MAILWETVDRLGRTVVLTEVAWAHIVDEHKDMTGRQDDVRRALERASVVRASEAAALFIRVVVRYRPDEATGWLGEVVTAHLTKRKKKGEQHRWP